ncbi:MAG: DUF979 domain-containing protein [Thermosediminibacteraceae bacterium]|nr:DUF979 domain-containing protein [Thermosediminibacteraceae bacterium]
MQNTLLELLYVMCGIVSFVAAYHAFSGKEQQSRIGTSLFWAILGIIFAFGKYMPKNVVGMMILVMAGLAAFKQVKVGRFYTHPPEFRERKAGEIGNKLFIPALAIAVAAFGVAQYTELGGLVGLGIGAIVALVLSLAVTRAGLKEVSRESGRLLQQVGPASILPHLLAALGALFNAADVGDVISKGISTVLPGNNVVLGVMAYCVGMALFTMIMGNAFAAFAVITAGVGVPLVLNQGADPAVAAALAMTAGYCGTLMTPMAANFNIVSASILELKDKYMIIKKQIPIAIVLLVIHIILMLTLAF